jgi:hypothetical protein
MLFFRDPCHAPAQDVNVIALPFGGQTPWLKKGTWQEQ